MASSPAPFLYQTRTLLRLTRSASLSRSSFLRTFHSTPLLSETHTSRAPGRKKRDPIPFQLPPELELRNPDPREGENGETSTITTAERTTFEQIFQEIAARKDRRPNKSGLNGRPQNFSSGNPSSESRDAVNGIIKNAAAAHSETAGSIGLDTSGSIPGAYSAAEREIALLKFPPSLRTAAKMALGAADFTSGNKVPVQSPAHFRAEEWRVRGDSDSSMENSGDSEKAPEDPVLEKLRREERSRVEGSMTAAKTDFALWDILESEVFPMVDKLGIGNSPGKEKGASRRRNAAQAETELSMEMHGPLYPAYLLTALKRLDSGFATPSPLALNVLPRIKERGVASYVLGVSTPFYNALMGIYWHRYGNSAAVVGLLEEMRHAGLYFDEGTLRILKAMEQNFVSWSGEVEGGFLQEVMKMPEYEPLIHGGLSYWIAKVQSSIQEKSGEV